MAPHHVPMEAQTEPVLIFVLGAPCSGKSSLCAELSHCYALDHLSIGNELRELISPNPSPPIARIKSMLSASEIETFTSNVTSGTLAPIHLTPKYVKERIFPTGGDHDNIRCLIDGFPRDAARWQVFKQYVKEFWTPDERAILIVMNIEEELAHERFVSRGRAGDVFEKRFNEYERTIPEIIGAMDKDRMTIVGIPKGVNNGEGDLTEFVAERLEGTEAWERVDD
ncbi:P-loop containing nucleoside triphosphate hydrolase protein [Dothidotthia symphoricarpi CBS 119687]|uniref:P-loop containing nucleoside triphosphate hydrolase protein n=1 Tax=Dothidotthia symphoricarpi CBS 119687 TaxID=1392245 RepID=A0A6A6AGR5_9PLEO|nr:P-loop containing nucleoside triphosphate hydrolase protein [Dothidotthia symphoricarpi CBS 119687]KAF2130766.1 P-loop containing nucleoside triphosphate hydrolase protein [Dothidotthia symphoricarpi CBS 119687]